MYQQKSLPKTMLKFNKYYFLCFVSLFLTEIFIAVYIHDDFIRPYVGDFLVVILLYTFIKSFLNFPVKNLAVAVLLFAYLVETLQYFNVVTLIGLKNSKLANLIIGNYFAWADLVAYTLGFILILILESNRSEKQINTNHMDDQFPNFI